MADTERDMRPEARIDLNFPIEFDGETIDHFIMRRPKVKDQLKAQRVKGGDMERGMALVADLIERPVEMLHEIDTADMEALNDQLMAFIGRQDSNDGN